MRSDARFEQFDERRVEEIEVVRDVEADQARERGVRREHPRERAALQLVHDEDHVRPFEHPPVDAHERVVARACGSDVEVGALAEHAFGRRAPGAVLAADEENAACAVRVHR